MDIMAVVVREVCYGGNQERPRVGHERRDEDVRADQDARPDPGDAAGRASRQESEEDTVCGVQIEVRRSGFRAESQKKPSLSASAAGLRLHRGAESGTAITSCSATSRTTGSCAGASYRRARSHHLQLPEWLAARGMPTKLGGRLERPDPGSAGAAAGLRARQPPASAATSPTAASSRVAERFEGKRLNSPNDVVCRLDGRIFFTDPPTGCSSVTEGQGAPVPGRLPARPGRQLAPAGRRLRQAERAGVLAGRAHALRGR